MKKCLLFVAFLVCCSGYVQAQLEASNWYFGKRAGANFGDGSLAAPNVLFDGLLDTTEGCAVISDSDGELLFYTDGLNVFNRIHRNLENGDELLGSSTSSQSAIIVPNPQGNNLYYIFTVDFSATAPSDDGINVSTVDMGLDNGLGGIIPEEKNVNLLPAATEKITAVKHGNRNSFWVITLTHDRVFHAFQVNGSGVGSNPINSSIPGPDIQDGRGYMKVSPGGVKLAVANFYSQGAFLYDFNSISGAVSNELNLPMENGYFPYGVEFSQDNSRLYVLAYNEDLVQSKLYQFDLESADIQTSRVTIDTSSIPRGALQLGIDGKIYRAEANLPSLGVINNPSGLGALCNYVPNSVDLGDRICKEGLPPFVQSLFEVDIQFEDNCLGTLTEFSISTSQTIVSALWDFGDPASGADNTSTLISPTHLYSSAGTFTVTATITLDDARVLEFTKDVTIYPSPIANPVSDIDICADDTQSAEIDLSEKDIEVLGNQDPNENSISYHESQLDADENQNSLPTPYSAFDGQEIFVRIQNSNTRTCYDTTSFTVNLRQNPQLNIDPLLVKCPGEPVTVSAFDPDHQSYSWSTGSIAEEVTISEAGNYSVTVTGTNGCTVEFDFVVEDTIVPIIQGVTVNDNDIIINTQNGTFEYSIDGMNFQDTPEFFDLETGIYTAYARDLFDCAVDSFVFGVIDFQNFFTPNNDGHNDLWDVSVLQVFPNSVVYIHDRFGKLLKTLTPESEGWDGNFNNIPLPASDYWYHVVLEDGREFKGHFSLKR